jgi:hypothetical protein
MTIADLSEETLARLGKWRFDRIVKKHEGPYSYSSRFQSGQADFFTINGYEVLLPVPKNQHANLTVLRCIMGDDRKSMTVFLKNTSSMEEASSEFFHAGFVAVCDRFERESFFVAILYHEWFIIDEKPLVEPVPLARP